MDFNEYRIKQKELLKSLSDLRLEYIYSKTKLRIGDTVKFVQKGESYCGEKDVKYKSTIYEFDIRYDGKIEVRCNGIHYSPLIEIVSKCCAKKE